MSNSSHSSSSLLLPAILVAAFVLLSWVFVSNSYAYALINLGPRIDYGTGASVNTSVDLNAGVNSAGTSSDAVDTNVNTNTNTNVNVDTGTGSSSGGSAGTDAGGAFQLNAEALSEGEGIRVDRAQVETDGEASVGVEPQSVVTNGDLQAYASNVLKGDVNVEGMDFAPDTVEVRYRQEGRFLALVPITFTVRVIAHADGTVELKYPWYSRFTVDNSEELETELKVAVDNALKARMVGSVQAQGEETSPSFTAAESAEVAAEIHAVLSAREEAVAGVD